MHIGTSVAGPASRCVRVGTCRAIEIEEPTCRRPRPRLHGDAPEHVMEIAVSPSRSSRWHAVRRVTRRAWRGVRWPLAAILIGLGLLVQSALVAVWAMPFDPAQLRPIGGPLVIVDRHGRVLATIANPGGQADRDHWVSLADIPAIAQAAVVEAEDKDFWEHRGVDARGIARAAWLDIHARRAAFGGSTLTMQLARMVASPGQERSWRNKLGEALLAL